MTYNFDPERWYDNERAYLDHCCQCGALSHEEHRIALNVLEEKLIAMWRRLDGSYHMPEDG